MKSRDVGFDRSLIAAYGQDDRVCSYANPGSPACRQARDQDQVALFTDKEEIGSYGNTGMMSSYFVKFVMKMLALQGSGALLDFYETMERKASLATSIAALIPCSLK